MNKENENVVIRFEIVTEKSIDDDALPKEELENLMKWKDVINKPLICAVDQENTVNGE